jgi:putative peptidoglycan lipid II flippase
VTTAHPEDTAAPPAGATGQSVTGNDRDEADGSRIVRASAAVAAGTLLSRITGLARIGLLAYAIGRGTLSDTYGLANQTPNIVYELLLGGVLTATLVPVFVERHDDERAINAVFTVSLTALVGMTAIAMAASPLIADLYTFNSANEAAQQDVATTLIVLFLPQMVFYGLTALATALLNARRRFVAAAFAPVLNNVVVIAMVLTFVRMTSGDRSDWETVDRIRGDEGLLLLLGLGTTAGVAAMALVLLPAVSRAGVHLRPVFEWRHEAVRRVVRLSGWTIGYVIANQIALSVVLVLATSEAGGLTAYQFAFVFFQLPHGLLAVSITTTVMPELARHAADRDLVAFRQRFGWGLRLLSVVVLPAVAAFLVLEDPFVGLMRFGAFDGGDVRVTADTLEAFAIGLLGFSAYLYTLRGFYALADTRTPFLVNLFENGVNVALALALHGSLGVQGLALSYAIAYIVAAVLAYELLRRRVGPLDGQRTLRTTARALIAAAGLALTAWLVEHALWTGTQGSAVLTLVLAGVAGVGVYLALARFLRVRELTDLVGALVRRGPSASLSESGV